MELIKLRYDVGDLDLGKLGGVRQIHLMAVGHSSAALVIERRCKPGTWGQLTISQIASFAKAEMLIEHIMKEKSGKRYRFKPSEIRQYPGSQEMKAALCGYSLWYKLGADNIRYIAPFADTSGVKSSPEVTFQRNAAGRMVAVEPPPKMFDEPEPTFIDRVQENPLFGLF